jgi:hypothetical protein
MSALIFPNLAEPAVRPVLGALGLPQDRAADLTGRADDPLDQVAAEFALGHGFEDVTRKFLPQQGFEGELLDLALQLLRALFGLAPQIFDLALHRGDLFFLLADPQGQGGFGLVFRLVANGPFAAGDLGFFSGELVLVPPSRVFNERCRQRFRQLDLGSATWASQCWFGHGSCPRGRARFDPGYWMPSLDVRAVGK